ncbi:succinylarginine dihydrolase [Microbulbifer rhizosphaerae]|uniref:Succinylarginine dihydrolase n=1 Tax=Microbulbifer rhizosphaerae TaxID=1562603 RepID=A0A7W4WA47_9GAMM|nr:succinylarginine dihydrolase [Microbulbifer rhizosphaerae]
MSPWIDVGNQVARNAGYDTDSRLASGIKETLHTSTDRASSRLSQRGAFNLQLPAAARPVANSLRQFGFGSYVDQLETAMNRGAEQAVAEAAPVFKQAISNMTVNDALGIIRGGDTAATNYFRAQTESALRRRYQPIVESNLRKTGFYDQYKSMLAVYDKLPIANKPGMDLERHVIDSSMATLFSRIGEEEALIRRDPVARGSVLIGQVFGAR